VYEKHEGIYWYIKLFLTYNFSTVKVHKCSQCNTLMYKAVSYVTAVQKNWVWLSMRH